VHLIDQSLAKKLLDDIDTPTKANVLATRRLAGLSKRRGNSVRYEAEGCSTFHHKRSTRMVCQNEDRALVHRLLAPPTPPTLIRPGSANGTEHVSTKNPCADIPEASSSEVIIDGARRSPIATKHRLLKRASGHGPSVKQRATDSERIVDVLVRTGTEAV